MRVKKFIENIKFKRHIKILLLLFVIVGMFSGYTFADEVTTDPDEFIDVLYKAMTMLSRGRVLVANLAGKLMTNDIVYGGFLHLDSTLWTFWNVMKNFANFFLGFLLLFSILRSLLSSVGKAGNDKWGPLNVIKNTLVAGILIQMSWFLVGAVLDISTVCTAAIGGFPAQFLASNDEFKRDFSKDLEKIVKNKAVIDYSNESNPIVVQTVTGDALDQDDINSLIDTLLPSTDSLSGPLIYIGMIVFNFSDYNIQQVEDGGSRKELFLAIGINGALLLAYSIMMILLFIFNLMRLLVLWIAIPLMPLIILIAMFDFKIEGSFGEILNIKNLLKLAFKPVILTGALGLILVILVLIKGIINNDANTIDLSNQNMVINSQIKEDETYSSEMDINGLLHVDLNGFKEGFADLIVYILGLCLIYFVLKLATVKTGIKFIDDAMSGIFERVGKIMTNIPIVPIPGGGSVSIDTLSTHLSSDTVFSKAVGIDETAQSRKIDKMLRTDSTMYDSLVKTMGRSEFISEAYQISVNNGIKTKEQMERNAYYLSALTAKMGEWNKANRNNSEGPIDLPDIFSENRGTTTSTSSSTGSSSSSSSEGNASTTSTGTSNSSTGSGSSSS